MKYLTKLTVLLFALASVCFLCGCTVAEMERLLGMDQPKEAIFMLSFHREVTYPRGNLQSGAGGGVWCHAPKRRDHPCSGQR